MILFHPVLERLHLANGERRAGRLIVPSPGRPLVPRLRRQKVTGLTVLVHGTGERLPWPFALERGLIQTPAAPDRPLAAVERRCESGTIRHHPTADRCVSDGDATLLHQLFALALALRRSQRPPHAGEAEGRREVSSFEGHHRCSLASDRGRRGSDLPRNAGRTNVCHRSVGCHMSPIVKYCDTKSQSSKSIARLYVGFRLTGEGDCRDYTYYVDNHHTPTLPGKPSLCEPYHL